MPSQLHFYRSRALTPLGENRAARQVQDDAFVPGERLDPTLPHLDRALCMVNNGDVTQGTGYASDVLQHLTSVRRPAIVLRRANAVVALNLYGLAASGVPADTDVYAGDLDDITTTYLTGRSTLLVGERDDGRVVALGALRNVAQDICEITRMRVAPEFQGLDYGKAILTALEDQARRLGYRRAVLLTGTDQHPAIDLYRGGGYVITAVEQHGELAGVRMSKDF